MVRQHWPGEAESSQHSGACQLPACHITPGGLYTNLEWWLWRACTRVRCAVGSFPRPCGTGERIVAPPLTPPPPAPRPAHSETYGWTQRPCGTGCGSPGYPASPPSPRCESGETAGGRNRWIPRCSGFSSSSSCWASGPPSPPAKVRQR